MSTLQKLTILIIGLSASLTAGCSHNFAPVVYHHDDQLRTEGPLAYNSEGRAEPTTAKVNTSAIERESLSPVAQSLAAPVASTPPTIQSGMSQAQPLVISSASPAQLQYYSVKSRDTLFSIARAHGTSVSEVSALNGFSPSTPLRLGQSLRLPATSLHANTLPHVTGAAGGPLLSAGQMPLPPASAPKLIDPAKLDIESATASRQGFIWPAHGKIVSDFGLKNAGRRNDGIDIAVASGAPVRAARSGEVIYTGNEIRGYGNLVLIRHEDGYVSAYAHNREVLVKRGDFVHAGQRIAAAGQTGNASQPTLHFEIRRDRKPVDPIGYLPKG